MWMDKGTSEITVLGWPVSRNEHNVAPRRIEDRYRQSDGTDYVTCNRCNQTRSFVETELNQLLLETAWANENTVDISFADDLIPFAMKAAEDREESISAYTWKDGDWRNDPSIRPPWVATAAIWKAHAEYLGLNVQGMDRWQIVQTFRYYFPEKVEPRAITWSWPESVLE